MASDAQYFHATLYQFNDSARNEVIKRFNAKIRDSAARCTYNADKHWFSLVCPPGPIGPHADEVLAEVISSFMAEALRDAEDAEEPPAITRFPESSYEVEIDDEPLRYHETDAMQPEDVPRLPRMLHLINAEGASTFRFFNLDGLPQGLAERILTPRAITRRKFMETGSTLRSVNASDWLFNGRVGQPLPVMSTADEASMLGLGSFPRLEGTAKLEEQPYTITPWRFKGAAVSTSQWLQGLGQTEQDDPEEEQQNVPKEFQKMIVAEQSHQNPALGRVRVPAGGADAQQPSDSESDGESIPANADAGFKSLLAGNSESDSEGSPSSKSDHDYGTRKSFMHLLRGTPSQSKSPSKHRPQPGQLVLPSRPAVESKPANAETSDLTPARVASQPEGSSLSTTGTEFAGFNEFGSYGPQWATYRNGMVQADPRAMAEWQHQHSASSRAPPSEVSMATIRSYQGDAVQTAGKPSWARRIVQNRPPRSAALVDVATNETRRPIMTPPGLASPLTYKQLARAPEPVLGQLIDHEMDYLQGEPLAQNTRLQPQSNQPLQPISGVRTGHNTDDDDVVERLEPSPAKVASSKHFTMRQKAQKKGKGRSLGKTTGAKAQLPMPSPPPPPQLSKNPALPVVEPLPTNSDHLSEFLSETMDAHPSAKTVLHFGQILAIIEDRKGTHAIDGATKLVSNIGLDGFHFMTAMTSRLADAHFMLGLFQGHGPTTAKTFYEIHTKDLAGAQTKVLAACEPLRVVAVPTDDDTIGTVAMHFPIRIWDSIVKVIDAGAVTESRVPANFHYLLQSMHSCGDEEAGQEASPSFIAKVPIDSFSVERVYAKRDWSRELKEGVRLVVTEIQDMFLQSLDGPDANLEVTALRSRDSMIEGHRLWYEARIEGLQDAKEICNIAESVVSKIDGVGFYNRGWTRYGRLEEHKPKQERGFQGGKGQW